MKNRIHAAWCARWRGASRARLALYCLSVGVLLLGVGWVANELVRAAVNPQRQVRRSAPVKPKAPKPATTARVSQAAQVISNSRTNPDGTITPGQMLTAAPLERSVTDIMTEQLSQPTGPKPIRLIPEREGGKRRGLPQNPKAIEAAQWPLPEANAPVPPPGAPQTPSLQFDGATGPTETGAFPPDTMGAVGPTQYLVFLNGRLRTFNKTTGVADGVINADSDVFFSSVTTPPGASEFTFTTDPMVRYDRLTKRWFLVMIDVTLDSTSFATTRVNRMLIAVSNAASNGILSAGTIWTFYQFTGDGTLFTDYESLGVDADALYIGGNMFSLAGSFNSTKGFVIPKSPLLVGNPAIVWTFSGMVASSSGAGPFAPRGVDNYDASNTGSNATGYFIGPDNATFGTLMLRRVTNPGALVSPGPTMSANISVTTLTTSFPVNVPHLGNTGGVAGRLDGLDDRMFAAHLRNGRLWVAHNIGVNSSGTTTSANRNGARWYELQNLSTTPTVRQAGTVFDNTSPNDINQRSYWIPSIMVSGQGHAALACSIAGTNERVNAFTTGRLADDTLSTMREGPGGSSLPGYTNTSSAYNPAGDPGGPRRWGDYSYVSLDPSDDMTMWAIQEYCNGSGTYGVRVVKLLAPPPATPASAAPSSVAAGQASVNVTITGTVVSGSGFYDPGTGFDQRLAASIPGVTVNSVTYNSPTSVTLNLSTVGATNGAKNVTITNPDGQALTGNGILTITSGGSPQANLAVTKTDGVTTVNAGQTLTYTMVASNSGPDAATGATVTDTFPATLTGVSWTCTGSGGGTCPGSGSGNINASVNLPSGGSVTFTATATVATTAAAGTLTNTVSIAAPAGVTDPATGNNSATDTDTIVCPTITVNPTSLPNSTVNTIYSQVVSATGGTSPYTFAVTAGSLPTGLTLASGGGLTGTLNAAGTFNFTVTATAASGCTGSRAYTVIVNTLPTISAVAVSRQQGTAVSSSTIANVTDPDQTLNTLSVTVNSGATATVNGVTVSGIAVNAAGVVSANVVASCVATNASFTLTVTDAQSATATATLNVTVTANTAPVLTYANQSVAAGGSLTINPATGPSDNGSVTNIVVQSQGTYTGTLSVNSSTGVFSLSNAKPGGTHTITVRITDNCGTTTDASFTLTVTCPTITVNPTSLPNSSVNTVYNQVISATGGTSPYTFAVTTGSLPTGLTLASGGGLTGTLSAAGTFNFTVTATDANGCTGSRAYTVIVNTLPTISAVAVSRQQGTAVSSSTIANVTDPDQALNTLSVTVNSGASATVNGVTVSGIAVNAAGVVSANVVAACSATNASFTLTVTDAQSATATATLNVTVTANSAPVLTYANQSVAAGGSLTINPATGPSDNGSVANIVVQSQGTYTGTISVNNSTGVVSLSNAQPGGTHGITIRITDNCGTVTDTTFTVAVGCAAITVNPTSLPNSTVNTVYNQAISATGGTSPYTFAVTAGSLPTGLTLASGGGLTGTLNAAGTFNFTVTATDANSCTSSRAYTVIVNTLPTISAVAVSRQQGSAVASSTIANVTDPDQALNTLSVTVNSGATATVNGVTVSGIAVNAAGVVSANVVAACSATNASFTLTVTDAQSATATATLNVTVTANSAPVLTYANQSVAAGGSLTINPATGPSDNGSVTNIVVQSQGTYTGTLSVNSSTGVVSLSNAKPGGTHTITVRIADNCGTTTDASFMLTVTCPTVTVNPTTLANGSVNTPYSQTLSAMGGTSPYTFVVTAGSLPTGLTLASGGGLTGTPTTANTFNFTVTATDANGCTGSRAYTVVISVGNTTPTISAVAVSRQQGSAVASSTIANVTDPDQALNTLSVTVNSGATATVNGVTVSGLSVNAAGVVSANVVASCSATNASFTLTVTDAQSATATATLNVTVTANSAPVLTYANQSVAAGGSLTINPATGPSDNGSVASIIVQSQGTFTGTISVNSSTGVVSVSNAQPGGSHTITIRITDNCGTVTNTTFLLTIGCVTVTLNPPTLPNGAVGVPYSQTLTASGGTGPYTFTETAGALPPGLTLASNGALTGTPNFAGTFTFSLQAADANGCAGSQAYSISINTLPTLVPVALSRQQGSLVSNLTIANADDPDQLLNALVVTVNGGASATVNGVTVSTIVVQATGVVTANVVADCAATNASFTLTVTDTAGGTANATLNVTVTANSAPVLSYANQSVTAGGALTINPITGPSDNGLVASIVVQSQGTYTGTLSVNNSTGVVSLSNARPGGTHTITVRITDNCGTATEASFTLTVNCPTVTLVPSSLPGGAVGTLYSQTLTASGGTGPYTFAVTAGSLPTGLTLATGGALTGTPNAAGNFSFTVRATDANGCTGTQAYSISTCATITVNPASLPSGFVGTTYNQTFTQSGGSGSIAWSVSAGSLPGGLSLASGTGELTGTANAIGLFNFTIRATDVNGCFGERAYAVIVNGNGLQYFPLPKPIRLFDTRATIPGFPACEFLNQAIAADSELVKQARITCDGVTIPANAAALVGNATVTGTTGFGFVTLYPNGQTRPTVANLNYGSGETVQNAFTVALGSTGEFRAYSFAGTHLIVDVTGYFAPPASGGLYYHPLPKPIRLFDTRATIPGFPACAFLNQALVADSEITRNARITCDGVTIPSDALAIVGNGTAVSPAGVGFITLYPNGQARPPVATLNYATGQTVANAFTVGLDATGQFKVYSFAGTHFIVDVTGYYSTSPSDVNGTGLLYSPLPKPIRLFDTRATIPGFPACEFLNQAIAADSELVKQARITCDGVTIPANAAAIVGNGTVAGPTGFGFVTLYPNGQTRPPVANLNYATGQTVANAFTTGLGADGQFRIYSFAGTHFIADVMGYYAP